MAFQYPCLVSQGTELLVSAFQILVLMQYYSLLNKRLTQCELSRVSELLYLSLQNPYLVSQGTELLVSVFQNLSGMPYYSLMNKRLSKCELTLEFESSYSVF